MTRTPQFPGLLLALVGVLPAVPLHGQQSTGPSSACYVPGSGTVYLINATKTPSACRAGHMAFTLSPATGTPQLGPGGNSLPTNSQGAYDFVNNNGFVATGTWGTGNIPATGPGTRLMWYPRKAALRAGIVNGAFWDDASTGVGTAAFGLSPTASGAYAFATGTNPTASGHSSVAMGYLAQAAGDYAGAIGWGPKASGDRAIAMGNEAWATGYASVALGDEARATKGFTAALGHWAKAEAEYAIAIGNATASGSSAIAIGGTASGNSSIAIGGSTTASGTSSFVMGVHSVSSGIGSMAFGTRTDTNGKTGAIVFGDQSWNGWLKPLVDNQFVVRAKKFWLGTNDAVTATAGRLIETSTGAYLSSGGAWVSSSDSTKKHRWQEVDGEDVLSRLATMSVRSWSYREEGDSVRHMGPTAQDFRNAFGLGDSDKAIAGVDADGVSLVAVQALLRRTVELRRDNADLRASVESLRNEMDQLRAQLATLIRER